MSDKLFWFLVAVLALFKLSLVGWWPFLSLTHLQHDTLVFINQAIYLLEGDWLGPYSEYTLMKGPATAMWIALMNVLGIPLLMSHHLLYLGASILVVLAFRRLTLSNGYLLFVFALVHFSPSTFNYGAIASAFRGMLHQPLVLGLVALSIILFMDFVEFRRVNARLSVLLGGMLLLFFNNREEGLWIVPWFVWLIAIMAVYAWLERGSKGGSQGGKIAMLTLIPLAIWGMGTLAIAWKNHNEYGVFAVVELKTPQFKRAFGNLIGIKAEQWHPRYAAQPDVLDKLYSLPSGGELDLDHKERENRRPIHSLMLPWKFRSAVADAGYYEAGGQAVLNYYDRLGQEIDGACEKGRFECDDPLFELLPPWHPGYMERFPNAFWRVLERALTVESYQTIHDFYSTGTPRDRLFVSKLVNAPLRATEQEGDRTSPDFYYRMKKNKTKYSVKIHNLYAKFTLPLFWTAVVGLVLALYAVLRRGKLKNLDALYLGIAGTVLVQLVMFAILRVTGYSSSIRLYFLFYPVLYTFIALGLLSITRNLREFARVAKG
jgi:hypothetical protein